MKALPSSIGAEPKKLMLLGGVILAGVALYFWTNSSGGPPQAASFSSPSSSSSVPATVLNPGAEAPQKSSASPSKAQTRGKAGRVEDFRPSIKLPEGTDISRIDPRLKTELLARLRSLPEEGGARSVFEFYVPPAPPPPPVAAIKPTTAPVAVQPPPISRVAGPPPTPPIPLKLYGFAGPPGSKTRKAFFLDGDDILFGSENDLIRNRYRILRVGVLDVEVEDTVTKNRETIKITPENDA